MQPAAENSAESWIRPRYARPVGELALRILAGSYKPVAPLLLDPRLSRLPFLQDGRGGPDG
eukprot:COSAG01_NODE_500_length_16223_cov_42.586988_9_plen_61_part_00